MRILFLWAFPFFCSFGFALEITIKNNPNLRSSPNFIGTRNVVGKIKHGAKATVVESKKLPSGISAYKISLASIKPQSRFENSSSLKELWVYGSSQFLATDTLAKTEAILETKKCTDCNRQEIPATRPLKDFVQHIEEQSSNSEMAQPGETRVSNETELAAEWVEPSLKVRPLPVPQPRERSSDISTAARAIVDSLKQKGISCDLKPEQIQMRGVQCKGSLPGYPQPVRFYIPQNYVKSDKNKVNIFFHGFEAALDNKANIYQVNPKDRNGAGDFGGRLAESGNNETIIVVPESRSDRIAGTTQFNEKTYSRYFQDGTGSNFESFLGHIKDATGATFSATTLAGHSGGYLALNALLGYRNVAASVKQVALFDGSYYETRNITTWLNNNPENKMRLSWKVPGDVVKETDAFIGRVKRTEQLIQVKTDGRPEGSHMDNIRLGGYSDFLKDI